MRLKSAALFAVCFLFVSFWLHGGARCQSSVAPPLSLAAPQSVTDQGSPPAARCHWSGLNWWCSSPPSAGVLSCDSYCARARNNSALIVAPRPKGSPPMAPEVPMYPPPVVLATPPSATDDVPARTAPAKGSPTPATNRVSPPVAPDDVPARTATAKGSPPTATKNVSPPVATDDVPARTATAKGSARLAAAKNSPPPANAEDARAPAIDNILPTPGIGKLSPSQEPGPDGLIVVIDDDEETGQPLPIRPRPAKQSKVRQKPDTTEGRSAEDAEVEKLKTKLIICRGC